MGSTVGGPVFLEEGPLAAVLPGVPDRTLVSGEGGAAARRLDPDESRHPDRGQPGRLCPVGSEVARLPGAGALLLHRSAPARCALDPTALSRGGWGAGDLQLLREAQPADLQCGIPQRAP